MSGVKQALRLWSKKRISSQFLGSCQRGSREEKLAISGQMETLISGPNLARGWVLR